jgi:hypothetical protein
MLRQEHIPGGDRDWAQSYEYILLIRDLLSEQRIDFWVTVYPYGLQISRREWNNGRQFWGFKPDTVYSTRPQEYVEGFCQRNGIRTINMLQDFKKASETVFPLYWDYNGHWVAAGHEVVARALFRELEPYLRTEKSMPRVTADRIVLPRFPTSP